MAFIVASARLEPPMPPLSLTDDEYAAVQAAAAPIHPLQREVFLQALAKELERNPVVGPGLVHRLAAELQRRYVVEVRKEAEIAGVSRYRRAAHGTNAGR
jgi:hypothetical protein